MPLPRPPETRLPLARSAWVLLLLAFVLGLGSHFLSLAMPDTSLVSWPTAVVVALLGVCAWLQLWRLIRLFGLIQLVSGYGFAPTEVPLSREGWRQAGIQEVYARAGPSYVKAVLETTAAERRRRQAQLAYFALTGISATAAVAPGAWFLIPMAFSWVLLYASHVLWKTVKLLAAKVPEVIEVALNLDHVVSGEGPLAPRPRYLAWCVDEAREAYPFGDPPVPFDRPQKPAPGPATSVEPTR